MVAHTLFAEQRFSLIISDRGICYYCLAVHDNGEETSIGGLRQGLDPHCFIDTCTDSGRDSVRILVLVNIWSPQVISDELRARELRRALLITDTVETRGGSSPVYLVAVGNLPLDRYTSMASFLGGYRTMALICTAARPARYVCRESCWYVTGRLIGNLWLRQPWHTKVVVKVE